MQSSALHLPRCIDAKYESPTVKCKNTSPHFINELDFQWDKGAGNWHNTQRLSITASVAGPEWYLFLSHAPSVLDKHSPYTPDGWVFHFLDFFYYSKQVKPSMSECIWKKNKYHFHPSLLQRVSAVQVDKIWQFKWQEEHISCPFSNLYTSFLKKISSFFTIQWLGDVMLHYISLLVTQIWTHL